MSNCAGRISNCLITDCKIRIRVAGALIMIELVLGSAIICTVGFSVVVPSFCVLAPVVLGAAAATLGVAAEQ